MSKASSLVPPATVDDLSQNYSDVPQPFRLPSGHRQRGVFSLEMMFVLIVMVVALGYIIYNGGSLLGSQDVTNEQSNIGILISNTRKLKASSGYGTSGTSLVSALRVSKGLPNMSDDGTSLYNSWGAAVTVVSNGMTFTVTENGLPADACVTLATKISRGQKVTTSINAGTAVTGEVLPANATSSCSKDANVVAWTVY
ncbi:PilS-like protein [Ectopseudomonas oleovorans]|uniref:PilS-like protein n=2 Tax=Ectopseudomonas oleovorans TaxID=301 RepID=A0A3D9EGD1_ECTOL|nr:PilS-like protein [Pseudomonas oleovorans]